MRNLTKTFFAAALAVTLTGGIAPAYEPSVADLDAEARAVGNRRDVAEHIGEAIFTSRWAAEVSQVSANELDGHLIVGLRVWGVKFESPITREAFVSEVVALVSKAFAAAPAAEEVDLWTSVPVAVSKATVVNGDLAKPTTVTVFSITVRRDEASAALAARAARDGNGVYWDEEWARTAFKRAT
ncbi:MAG: hypothetical protein WA814_01150 [Candidatus Baltobacteraceae bacterium]